MEVETVFSPAADTDTVKRRIAFQKSFSQEVSEEKVFQKMILSKHTSYIMYFRV